MEDHFDMSDNELNSPQGTPGPSEVPMFNFN